MNYDRFKTPENLPGIRMRGQNDEEHEWLAGFEGRPVQMQRVDDRSFSLVALNPAPAEGEATANKTLTVDPEAGKPKLYDKMEYDDLVTEAVRRGLNPYREVGNSGQQPMSKSAIVKMLREADQASKV